MPTIFETMSSRARDCQQIARDIELIRPITYETNPPMEKLLELVNGAAAIYELRFAALFEAYSAAIRENGFFSQEIEDCVMQWWGICDDLRSGGEGARDGILDTDGFDNVLLGAMSLSQVRAARFFRLFEAARPGAGSAAAPRSVAGGSEASA